MEFSSGPSGAGVRKEVPLLAPLPRLHRILVLAAVLVAAIGGGLLLAYAVPALPLPTGGLLLGSALGLAAGFLLVHDFHPAPRPVRVQRRR